jgi:hypothetical protein
MIFPRLVSRRLVAAVLGVLPLAALAHLGAACSGNDRMSGVAAAKLPAGAEALEHETCEESGNRVEVLDTNGDGKPDIRRVFDKSGHELCRVADLNHDGKPDLYEYFDSGGNVRRREFCYDDTGVVNAIEHYEGGRLAKREYDTSGQHRIDTWDYFDPGVPMDPKTGRPLHPSRRERDRTGNGRVDEWWTWQGDKVSIARDMNGDGKPDPASLLILGGAEDAGPPAVASNGPPPAPVASGASGTSVPSSSGASAVSDAGAAEGGKR